MPNSNPCVMLKHGISVYQDGRIGPCCQFDHFSNPPDQQYDFNRFDEFKADMASLDQKFREGYRDHRCRKCWHDEDLGYPSLRQESNRWYEKHNGTNNDDIWHMEIRLGNYCNLKCIMCSPYASSTTETEFLEHEEDYKSVGLTWNINKNNNRWWSSDEFMSFLDRAMPKAMMLNFTGGEPFMVPALPTILEKISRPGSTLLLFNTNMTKINQSVLEILKRFSKISMSVSLEGVGSMNDYVRHPSDFNEIEANIELIENTLKGYTDINWMINHVFQHTSIYALPALVDWAQRRNWYIHFTGVFGQDFLDIHSAPPKDIEKFRQWLDGSQLVPRDKDFITNKLNTYEFRPDLYEKYRKYIDMLDRIRKLDYNKVFEPSSIE